MLNLHTSLVKIVGLENNQQTSLNQLRQVKDLIHLEEIIEEDSPHVVIFEELLRLDRLRIDLLMMIFQRSFVNK